ncbi:TIGR03619 family F420-dependent LLM class oxidoreductase [Actinomadura sp. B10D3]|uniref:TIGR03619 family F420-dependent LLM class oxidoreductase n=1 Tax=Actinomadura sp. B10D3 TaxID=3153557 RepID=UPI00325F8C6F
MKFTIEYPVAARDYDPALVTGEGVARVAGAIEREGYDAVAFTEHPAPSLKWIEAGGHHTLDIVSALSFCAARTTRLRLMTYLLVLPYHNPFAAAKALTTLDLLSGGRVTVVAGTGYLRSEFLALRIDMDARNEIFDESVEVMRGVWTRVPFHHEGRNFVGKGVASLPGPVQPGGPPILVGGNSAVARRRAAANQGWSPLLMAPGAKAATTRTPPLATIEELAVRVTEVRERAAEIQGPDAEVTVQVQTPESGFMKAAGSYEEHRDHIGRLAEAGVDSFVLQPPGDDVRRLEDVLAAYAAEVVRR